MSDIKYWVESSFEFEDQDKLFPETLVVISDLGDEIGTETIGTFPIDVKVELGDLIRVINEQLVLSK